MLEALYNITLLIETGAVSYLMGKMCLDAMWFVTLDFLVRHDMLSEDVVHALHRTGEKL